MRNLHDVKQLAARHLRRAASTASRSSRNHALIKGTQEEPIRGEIFGADRLEAEAKRLARTHTLAVRPGPGGRLRRRLRRNAESLMAIQASLSQATRQGHPISLAADWYLDNFHVVLEQLREIDDDLPPQFDRQLPKLTNGELAGFPRVYAIAVMLIEHTDSRLDRESLERLVKAYQTIEPLAIGEIWALAIALRAALVENLRRLATRLEFSRSERAAADRLADRLLATIAGAPTRAAKERAASSLLRMSENVSEHPSTAFVVRLVQRLRDVDAAFGPALRWIEDRSAAEGRTFDEAVLAEHQRQTAAQATISNILESMRLLSDISWGDFFEAVSPVETTLREDPAEAYGAQDFETRDIYRHAIEEIGHHDGRREAEAARIAVEMAAQRTVSRERHVGFFLIDRGRPELERALRSETSLRERARRKFLDHASGAYLAAIFGATAVLLAGIATYARLHHASPGTIAAAIALMAIPASELSLHLVNFLTPFFFGPRALPKLEFESGVPEDARTLVAVPCLLTSVDEIRELVASLEIQSHANPDVNLHFALLSDFPDSASETEVRDDELLEAARISLEDLNARYRPPAETAASRGSRFYLVHRRRIWNAADGIWMGWERKRGKLIELNRLLRGGAPVTNSVVVGNSEIFPSIRFVFAIDADTRLPRNVVRTLAGTLRHPLNRPVLDPATHRVVDGYGILQPRVSIAPESAHRSRFARISSGHTGIDPYTTAVSNVYQDLFAEGSYTGKAIYDVDAFSEALEGRIPDNAVLSHDLLEGCFARSGLATDIEIFEDHPFSFDVYSRRQHRWIRGDWQILRWVARQIPSRDGSEPNLLGPLSQWKIWDNVRRSLVAPAMLATMVVGWLWLPGSAIFWTAAIILTIAFPIAFHLSEGLTVHPRGIPWTSHFWNVWGDLSDNVAQLGLRITALPFLAGLSIDAAVRALYRSHISHRRLLDWTTAAAAEKTRAEGTLGYARRMWRSLFLVAAVSAAVAILAPKNLPVALPFLLLWLASPAIANHISQPYSRPTIALTESERRMLRQRARQTWRFFEVSVTEADHGLPADNLQADRDPILAHRTSPTNIGVYLLSAVVAHDFGYLGTIDLIERLELAFDSMSRMARYQGHLFNWYDTTTLAPLLPQYVSTVDSGNLAACCIALKHACLAIADGERDSPAIRNGLADVVRLAGGELRGLWQASLRTDAVTSRQLRQEFDSLSSRLDGPDALSDAELVSPAGFEELDCAAAALSEGAGVLSQEHPELGLGKARAWVESFRAQIRSHRKDGEITSAAGARLRTLAQRAEDVFTGTDFRFLYDGGRELFTVGFNVSTSRPDKAFYDLLASEARIASFIAIAKGDVPAAHWFRLQRRFTVVGKTALLISWSGSMFEYLMPFLLMRLYPDSLLETTCVAAVDVQEQFGSRRRIPWGVSEAAYNSRDLQMNYQYGPFGVDRLALRRSSPDDVVVAPYASFLALEIDPEKSCENLRRLESQGALSDTGFFESLDYAPNRVPPGNAFALVRTCMAHHQGMILLAIANALRDGVMRRRFHADPAVQAAEMLLQERVPPHAAVVATVSTADAAPRPIVEQQPTLAPRRFHSPDAPRPRAHFLSNGSYSVMLTTAGSGWSRRGPLAMTRWREDLTRDNSGSWIYLRDVRSGLLWSSAFHPTARRPRKYEVDFSEHKVQIRRVDANIETVTDIIVSPEDDAELRRVSLTNMSTRSRDVSDIEVTSYSEIVLAPPDDERFQPAFSSLFVETEIAGGVLICKRRPRSFEEAPAFAAHIMATDAQSLGVPQYETDRARFLGRGRSARAPAAMVENRPLSNTTGPVLDPIVSWRQRIRLGPGQTAQIVFTTAFADSREAALALAGKYKDPEIFDRQAELAWMRSQVQMRHLNVGPEEAQLFQRLGSRVLFGEERTENSAGSVPSDSHAPEALWPLGISGNLPIVLARISDAGQIDLIRQLLRAHEFWRFKGLIADLVILNEEASSYAQPLGELLTDAVNVSPSHGLVDKPGGIFLRNAGRISPADQRTLQAMAQVIVVGTRGPLSDQIDSRAEMPPAARLLAPAAPVRMPTPGPATPTDQLAFFNGIGGFSPDGKEYVVVLEEDQWTPTPWINVIANPDFGFLVSEAGSGPAWSVNSQENRLTPWSNDPVADPPGEIIYLRDEDSGRVWTPTPLPIREKESYVSRHGQGYTIFQHSSQGIETELEVFVPPSDGVKISRLRIRNLSGSRRRLSLTYYVEWVLGRDRMSSSRFLVTECDPETGAILVRNPASADFADSIAFADIGESPSQFTTDRREFLGRNGDPAEPVALGNRELSGAVGAGFDPCAALQRQIEIPAGAAREVVFCLGEGRNRAEASALIRKYREATTAGREREAAIKRWDDILSVVRVHTPDSALDTLLNRWLLYQTLSCRIWGRTAFYQSSGAFGYRDQLQDVMALVASVPAVSREHLLRCAARQFPEGDVQHWWHPQSGQGVRTRCSDDRLWLPFAVAHYIDSTGDTSVLDELVPYLEAPVLAPGEKEAIQKPAPGSITENLDQHCRRAIEASLALGEHGLPLIGAGDWNDGFNRVGIEGRGESVWLGWFLNSILLSYAPIVESRGATDVGVRYREHADRLKKSIEQQSWDGDWYRRAYYDDGTPLGSANDEECRIDSIAQSWAVISGSADRNRAERAMIALETYLLRREDGLIVLLTPPFDRGPRDPGYIKGYLPGIRENGGQYSHAAAWASIAFASLGDGDRAAEILSMINPIAHTSARTALHRYKTEPYAVAGDVYSQPPHTGRGGWTWYTGSAAWMYRAGIESLLGFRLHGDHFVIEPCVPRAWASFDLEFRDGSTMYSVTVENIGAKSGETPAVVEMDGHVIENRRVPRLRDGMHHRVLVRFGA